MAAVAGSIAASRKRKHDGGVGQYILRREQARLCSTDGKRNSTGRVARKGGGLLGER